MDSATLANDFARRRRVWVVAALTVYSVVMVSLTMLKAFFVIGFLWVPENQRDRGLEFVPMADFGRSDSWFAPLFDSLGNVAFFVPFGVLAYILFSTGHRPLTRATATGAALSLAIEASQYLFSLGRTDIDDLIFNTLGALVGAAIARSCGPRMYPVWTALALAAGIVFFVLVVLGERLGDPDKVVDVGAAPAPHVNAVDSGTEHVRPALHPLLGFQGVL